MVMFKNLKGYHLVLASASPRRSELLKGLGLTFEVRLPEHADEAYPPGLAVEKVAEYIAAKKAVACLEQAAESDLFITADTVVCLEDVVLGKPADACDAFRMLQMLSGKSHDVYTGVCITSAGHQVRFTDKTRVDFALLEEEEIRFYVENFKPYDKAGSYGIQEWIGFALVTGICGSYFNVMGLPVGRLYTELKRFPER